MVKPGGMDFSGSNLISDLSESASQFVGSYAVAEQSTLCGCPESLNTEEPEVLTTRPVEMNILLFGSNYCYIETLCP